MKIRIPARTSVALVTAGTAASALMGGLAVASIPGSDGVVSSCYDSSRVLRVLDSTATCPTGTTSLKWNQRGPTGLTGPQGPQGLQGPAGPGLVHFVRLAGSDGHITAKSAGMWAGNWGVGRYYVGGDGFDLSKCAISVLAMTDYTANPVMVTGYTTYSAYTLFEVKQIVPNSWPIRYQNVGADTHVTITCAP